MCSIIQSLISVIGWIYNKLSSLHNVIVPFSFQLRSLFTLFHFEQMALLPFFIFLQNLILLIAFCYWQYFSVFTSCLALGKGNKVSIGWINHLKNMKYIFPKFLPYNLPLYKHHSFKINLPGNMYSQISMATVLFTPKMTRYL